MRQVMRFQFNSDNQTPGNAEMAARIQDLTLRRLDRISSHLTRIEVHVGDINGPRGGIDKRCSIEVRPAGMPPVSAVDQADSIDAAVSGATGKVLAAFDRQIGKRTTRKGH
ncbi:hypothetical protein DMC47_08205 [Nostoc sp. 3335mG]|nr:hypothetical protein DMC47_08205 [Nostoc sp. 3335mG]